VRPVVAEPLEPAAVLALIGHPRRWQLLSELARSDRRVLELVETLGQPQNLVSYHLGCLRAKQVVSMRRSSADRREVYYRLDLERCGDLLSSVGRALHPGLRLVPAGTVRPGRLRRVVRVLFLCTGNSARSQMAEALLQQLAGTRVAVVSAGSHPSALHPNAVRVMAERGIDLRGRRAKHLSEFQETRFDYVVTLCDRVREVCPDFPGQPEPIHWSIPNPSESGDTDEETYPAFEQVADELSERIRFLLSVMAPDAHAGPALTSRPGG
jgi:protein-tyrosine-phosphatase/DNA-binding transcriptional ArsR family regulator